MLRVKNQLVFRTTIGRSEMRGFIDVARLNFAGVFPYTVRQVPRDPLHPGRRHSQGRLYKRTGWGTPCIQAGAIRRGGKRAFFRKLVPPCKFLRGHSRKLTSNKATSYAAERKTVTSTVSRFSQIEGPPRCSGAASEPAQPQASAVAAQFYSYVQCRRPRASNHRSTRSGSMSEGPPRQVTRSR